MTITDSDGPLRDQRLAGGVASTSRSPRQGSPAPIARRRSPRARSRPWTSSWRRPRRWSTGEVRDAPSNATLPGATVSVDTGQTATTDSQGRYRIDLPPGTYQVTAAAAGYVSSTGTAVINGGSYATLDFSLARTPSSGTTLTFTTTADSTVKSSSPTKNYGKDTEVRLRLGTPRTRRPSRPISGSPSPGWQDAASRARSCGCGSPTPGPSAGPSIGRPAPGPRPD